MSSSPRKYVLLVEDDVMCRLEMKAALVALGLTVVGLSTAEDTLERFFDLPWSLVIIHLGLDQMKSLDLCRWVKARRNVPLMMLINRGEIVTEEMALLAGADDYAIKPVHSKILRARVGFLLPSYNPVEPREVDLLVWDGEPTRRSPQDRTLLPYPFPVVPSAITLNLDEHRFFVRDKEVALTKSEFLIMRVFMENQNQVLTRGQLLDALKIQHGVGSDHIIDAHLSRLRQKIRRENGGVDLKSVHGVGFRLAAVVTLTPPIITVTAQKDLPEGPVLL